MKKRIFIVCYLLGILLTGCNSSLPADDPPEEVSAYSSNSPQEDVPYYEDIKGSSLSGKPYDCIKGPGNVRGNWLF